MAKSPPDDRDLRRRRTPPENVRAQTAAEEVHEDPEEITPRATHIADISNLSADEVREIDRREIGRRVRETKVLTIQSKRKIDDSNAKLEANTVMTSKTLDTIGEVRAELKSDIVRIDGKFEVMDHKITTTQEHVADLREKTASISGKIGVIGDLLEEDREHRRGQAHLKITERTAELDIDKAKALSDIKVKETGALTKIEVRKTLVYKALAGIGAVWAVVSVYLIAQLSSC